MSPSIHIIIVNWNTRDRLRECLRTIALADRASVRIARVTVVDNASSDSSAMGLEGISLPLEVIRNESNLGFAAACNQGAAGSTVDYLLFLNPDTRLFADTLSTVARFMESEPAANIGICGVEVLDDEGKPGVSCSRFPTLRVLFGKMTGLNLVVPQFFPSNHLSAAETRQSRLVDQVVGAFYFVRRELFARLGGFDERYFMYFEDVDFALRARQAGASSYFLKDAKAFHAENVSSAQVQDRRLYYSLRSRLLFADQHWPRWQANALMVLTFGVELPARLMRAASRRSGSDMAATMSGYGVLFREIFGAGATFRTHTAADHVPSRTD
jgi:N-acetylglucosaminyl-diphospho-decaprenol L-rhamnosyltransferase